LLERSRYRVGRRLAALHFLRNKMPNGLGIRFTDEFAALFPQPLAQLAEVLDDAVMDHRNQIGGMGMSIILARPAMGGPTRVTDADRPAERLPLEPRLQCAKLAFRAATAEYAAIKSRHTSGVVSSVFEALECIDQLPRNRFGS
jgi:hypothetical protein